jgi:hypothetical protein
MRLRHSREKHFVSSQMNQQTKTHLTYAEAAKVLTDRGIQITERTVRSWVANGNLRVLDLGHHLKRIPVEAIDRMIKENTR